MTALIHMLTDADCLRRSGKRYAVATVVRSGGSTYRRPGARLLVTGDGRPTGLISGGCLESEAARISQEVLATGRCRIESFDLSDENEITGFGAGCVGTVDVLIEPFPSSKRLDPLEVTARAHKDRSPCVLVQVIEGSLDLLGQKVVWRSGYQESDTDHVFRIPAREVARVEATGRHTIVRHNPLELLLEAILPPIRLVLFGSGLDVAPVAQAGKALGWQVSLVGSAPAAKLESIAPAADDYTFLMHPEDLTRFVALDNRSAVVVMNHHYVRDRAVTKAILKSPVQYIGLLGPRVRAARIAEDLKIRQPHATDRLFGPVGLDIGAETPEEIAIAIVAEIQAAMTDHNGGMLRDRTQSIHSTVRKLG